MPSRVDDLLAAKRAHLHRLTPIEAFGLVSRDSSAFLVDTRPALYREAEGAIPGAVIVERNVLEWRLDPTSAHAIPEARRPGFRPILVCNEGFASSLAAASLVELGASARLACVDDAGLVTATDLVGGYRQWKKDGLPTSVTADPSLDRSQPVE